MAATRTRFLQVDVIARRLEDDFTLLNAGGRGTHARHQSLGAAINWSFNLLSEAEGSSIRRLAVSYRRRHS